MNSNGRSARVSLVALYSSKYPAIGETHGISVLAGVIASLFEGRLDSLALYDMVASGTESDEQLEEFVRDTRPDILGISVTYGTYDFLTRTYGWLKATVGPACLIVLGGPLATYLPQKLLQELDSAALVVCGEGEVAFAKIVQCWLDNAEPSSIPGLVRMHQGRVVSWPRRLVDLSRVAAPYRRHIRTIVQQGAQVFSESSRGCSWAACTFCLRGLTDIAGNKSEYRVFPRERLLTDLRNLSAAGVRTVTFADEDFFGKSLPRCEELVETMEAFCGESEDSIEFDVSMTPHSIYTAKMSGEDCAVRSALVERLARCGLRKAFLGVESGSKTQLRRSAKGHTKEEAARAIQILREKGVSIELGWIMFDALCSLEELKENSDFLDEHSLVAATSYLFNELRIQPHTAYERLAQRAEKDTGSHFIDWRLDPNTLSYNYEYRDNRVRELVHIVRAWSKRLRPLHYPLKNFSRYGKTGILGEFTVPVNELLANARTDLLACFEELVTTLQDGGAVEESEGAFESVLSQLAEGVVNLFVAMPQTVQKHPEVARLLEVARPGCTTRC